MTGEGAEVPEFIPPQEPSPEKKSRFSGLRDKVSGQVGRVIGGVQRGKENLGQAAGGVQERVGGKAEEIRGGVQAGQEKLGQVVGGVGEQAGAAAEQVKGTAGEKRADLEMSAVEFQAAIYDKLRRANRIASDQELREAARIAAGVSVRTLLNVAVVAGDLLSGGTLAKGGKLAGVAGRVAVVAKLAPHARKIGLDLTPDVKDKGMVRQAAEAVVPGGHAFDTIQQFTADAPRFVGALGILKKVCQREFAQSQDPQLTEAAAQFGVQINPPGGSSNG